MNVTLIILAVAAAFLGLRLYSVLGKRTGHEQEPTLPTAAPRSEQRSTVPEVRRRPTDVAAPALGNAAPASEMLYEPQAEPGIRALLAADRTFNVGAFVEGSKAAYRMILEAYWQGDRTTLRALTDDDTYAAFAELIDERSARGETLDNRLVTIDSATIGAAEVVQGYARIAVTFDADIAAVTRDADGKIIAGSLSDAVQTHDMWTFGRALSSSDPNWRLEETDVA